jgi:hypothetical protein
MPRKATPVAVAADEPDFGVATILDRQIKVHRLQPDQLLVADMMARRLQRLSSAAGPDGRVLPENWDKFLKGTRTLLDWIGSQFVVTDDLEWFEEMILTRQLDLSAIGPLMTAMGSEQKPATKSTNSRARRAK